jgi:hypothetical protein
VLLSLSCSLWSVAGSAKFPVEDSGELPGCGILGAGEGSELGAGAGGFGGSLMKKCKKFPDAGEGGGKKADEFACSAGWVWVGGSRTDSKQYLNL